MEAQRGGGDTDSDYTSGSSSTYSGSSSSSQNSQRYETVSGTVVRVEYETGTNFIINYNSYDVTVEYDGETYQVEALNFVRIDG